MADMDKDIRFLKGVGEKRAAMLRKLGVFTVRDIICFFPRRYEDRSRLTPIAAAGTEPVLIKAMLASDARLSRVRRGMELLKVRAVDDSGSVNITFFNQSYLREQLTKACAQAGIRLVLPAKKHCTDNAAMIAAEGLVQYRLGHFSPLSINAEASIPLRSSQ